MNLLQIAQMNEEEARKYLENIRWPKGPTCPRCGHSDRIYELKGQAHRPGVYKCGSCRKQFTVTVGTVMERSHITIRQWVIAFHLMCSSKKGVSAAQLQRELGLGSYKSAWFVAHRIRTAMDENPLAELLSGTVEVDETYVGGKNKKDSKRGRGTKKTPVVALISRDQKKAYSKPVKRVNARELKGTIREYVAYEARIMTDEWPAYSGIGQYYVSGHCTVNHSEGEYSRGDIHVNNAESFFALLKRGIHGVFHHVSKKHLSRYCHEFAFRWNRREDTDGNRTVDALRSIEGKRLFYKVPKGSAQVSVI